MSRRLCCALTLLFLSAVSLAQAQNREISGKVLNAVTREAIPYPTISVVGGIQAAQGDARGEFRIVVPVAPVTLSARAIGYKRGAVKVPEAQSSIELALDRDVLNLEAVVVTGQATSVESRNSPTAVRNISSDQLNAVPAQSPEQALQGKVPGALINMNSGAPGGGGQMQIRGVSGANSVTGAANRNVSTGIASNQDNGTNRLADFVTGDMESVQVLEGAAASASIYGSRATNGVVIITTKRGRHGETQFHVTQRVGRYDAIRLPGSRVFPNKAAAFDAVRYNVGDSARAQKLVSASIWGSSMYAPWMR